MGRSLTNGQQSFYEAATLSFCGVVMTEKQGFLGSLGITTKFASPLGFSGDDNALFMRFYLQSLARQIAPKDHRVKTCLRVIAPNKDGAQVRIRGEEKKKASYGNLMICASIWACPICAMRISEQRSKELQVAVTRWKNKGYLVVMLTYTFSHSRKQPLKDVLATLKDARRRFKAGKGWQNLIKDFAIFGTIGAVEITWGANGWHPHVHELLFLKRPKDSEWIGTFEGKLQDRWIRALEAVGGSGKKDIALKLSASDEYMAEYIAKFGRPPKDNSNWDMVKEVSKAVTKKGHHSDHATPLELLIAYGNKSELAASLWREYIIAFHGKQQMVWSKGLKAFFKIAEVSEDEIALDDTLPYSVLAVITPQIWGFLMQEDKLGIVRAEILSIAQNDGLEAMLDYINQVTEVYQVGQLE